MGMNRQACNLPGTWSRRVPHLFERDCELVGDVIAIGDITSSVGIPRVGGNIEGVPTSSSSIVVLIDRRPVRVGCSELLVLCLRRALIAIVCVEGYLRVVPRIVHRVAPDPYAQVEVRPILHCVDYDVARVVGVRILPLCAAPVSV